MMGLPTQTIRILTGRMARRRAKFRPDTLLCGKSEPDGYLQYIPVARVPDLCEALQNAIQRVPKPWWEAHVDAPARGTSGST